MVAMPRILLHDMSSRGNMRSLLLGKRVLYLAALVVTGIGATSFARDLTASITYVAWRTLYVDAGRAHGLSNDFDGLLYRDNTLVGELRVVAVAESSCVATLSGDSIVAQIGDQARFVVYEGSEQPAGNADTTVAVLTKRDVTPERASRRKILPRVTGRVGFQMDMFDDRSSENIDYAVPGVSTKFTINRIASENSNARIKYRGRKLSPSSEGDWQHRLYEASLNFESETANWHANLGRIQAGSIAGIGYIDGGYGEVEITSGLSVGAFAGAQAVLDLSSTDLSTSKVGVLAVYRDELSTRVRTQASFAVAGEYQEGNISREFFYQQLTHSLGSNFSLYESSDFNINRGWKQDIEGTTISLANMLVNLRYSPARAITLNAGYDGRSRYHTWETRETPDSLFDEAIRHGFRAGVELSMLKGTRLSAQQSYRSEPHTNSLYPSGAYSLSSTALLNGLIGTVLRFGTFENIYSTGNQQAASISVSPLHGLDLRTEYGTTSYYFREQKLTTNHKWLRLTSDLNLRSGWFSSISVEHSDASNNEALHAFFEFGKRFR